jgi:hypothetical protein
LEIISVTVGREAVEHFIEICGDWNNEAMGLDEFLEWNRRHPGLPDDKRSYRSWPTGESEADITRLYCEHRNRLPTIANGLSENGAYVSMDLRNQSSSIVKEPPTPPAIQT